MSSPSRPYGNGCEPGYERQVQAEGPPDDERARVVALRTRAAAAKYRADVAAARCPRCGSAMEPDPDGTPTGGHGLRCACGMRC